MQYLVVIATYIYIVTYIKSNTGDHKSHAKTFKMLFNFESLYELLVAIAFKYCIFNVLRGGEDRNCCLELSDVPTRIVSPIILSQLTVYEA